MSRNPGHCRRRVGAAVNRRGSGREYWNLYVACMTRGWVVPATERFFKKIKHSRPDPLGPCAPGFNVFQPLYSPRSQPSGFHPPIPPRGSAGFPSHIAHSIGENRGACP